MLSKKKFRSHVRRDLLLFALSTIAAILLSQMGVLEQLFHLNVKSEYIAAFIAGILFTSFLTTPFAIATFLSLAPEMNVPLMVLIGASGAVFGDLFLFGIIRNTFKEDLDYLVKKEKIGQRFKAVFQRRAFRWIIPFVGALIIASPLPDELGIALMGVSSMRVHVLLPISFAMNALGISLVALIA